MHTSVPVGPRRSAIRRAWPPAPKVQSTTVSPGAGAVSSISSPARTGTCARVMSRRIAKALGHLPDLRVEGALLLLPALLGPDLEVVADPDHDDLLLDAGVLEQRRREDHPPACAERALDDRLVCFRGPDSHAGFEVLRENGSRGERRAEASWDAQPVLRVQRVLEVASKWQCTCPRRESSDRSGGVGGAPPLRSIRCRHGTPLSPTLQHRSPQFRPMRREMPA